MRITHWGEHGLHFSLQIAAFEARGITPVTAAVLAEAQGIEVAYAQKILQKLRAGNIIDSVRGPTGGFRLTRPTEEILLYDILIATEGVGFEVICETHPLDPERCASDSPCSVRTVWQDLREHINTFLRDRTLSDLLREEQEAISRAQIVQIGASSTS